MDLRSSGGAEALYNIVISSNFIKNSRNLRSFVHKVLNTSPATSKEVTSMRNIIGLVEELLDRFPESAAQIPVDVIENGLEKIRNNFPVETLQAITKVLNQQKVARDRVTKQMRNKSSTADEFEDFREMPLFPSAAELNVDDDGRLTQRLSKNIISGKYDSVMHYLDTHFRLLREDAITSIRDGIRAFRLAKEAPDVQIYTDVHMRGITTSSIGVQYRVSFHVDANISWERSKRFVA
jgi:hypothetical protein